MPTPTSMPNTGTAGRTTTTSAAPSESWRTPNSQARTPSNTKKDPGTVSKAPSTSTKKSSPPCKPRRGSDSHDPPAPPHHPSDQIHQEHVAHRKRQRGIVRRPDPAEQRGVDRSPPVQLGERRVDQLRRHVHRDRVHSHNHQRLHHAPPSHAIDRPKKDCEDHKIQAGHKKRE